MDVAFSVCFTGICFYNILSLAVLREYVLSYFIFLWTVSASISIVCCLDEQMCAG